MTGKMIRRVIAAAVFSALLLLSACAGSSQNKAPLTFGTAGKGGTYEAYVQSFSEFVKDDLAITMKTTAGSASNVRLMQKGFIDAAITQNDILYNAQEGIGSFEGKVIKKEDQSYSAAAAIFTEAVQIVVKADSGIESIGDLKGRSVSVGEKESGVLDNAVEFLDAYDMELGDVNAFYLSYSDAADAIKEGTIDAFFCTAGAPTAFIGSLAENTDVRLLSTDRIEAGILKKQYPYFTDCVIPAGTYPGQEEDVETLGVKAVIIVSNSLDNAAVKKLTEDIIKYADQKSLNICTDDAFDVDFAVGDVPIAFHEGAAEYYKEQGLEVPVNANSGTGIVFGGQDN